MKRISAWFDRHPRTRIALQLALDGAPVLVMVLHLLSGYSVKMLTTGWDGAHRIVPSTFYYVTLVCLMVIPIPAFVASFFWRDKAFELFEQHRWSRRASNLLRIAGALVVAIAFLLDILFFAMWTMTW